MTNLQQNQEQIMTSLTDLFNKIDAYYKPQMEAEFSNISLSEIETIEFIAKTPYPNVTKLAHHLYMTRGAASKIAKKLLKKNLVESYQIPQNKEDEEPTIRCFCDTAPVLERYWAQKAGLGPSRKFAPKIFRKGSSYLR